METLKLTQVVVMEHVLINCEVDNIYANPLAYPYTHQKLFHCKCN